MLPLPSGLASLCLLSSSVRQGRRRLDDISDTCLFHAASRYIAIYAFLDWSPFKPGPRPRAAAAYFWQAFRLSNHQVGYRAERKVDGNAIRIAIRECHLAGRHEATLSAYGCVGLDAAGEPLLEPLPLLTGSVPLFPPYMRLYGAVTRRRRGAGRTLATPG